MRGEKLPHRPAVATKSHLACDPSSTCHQHGDSSCYILLLRFLVHLTTVFYLRQHSESVLDSARESGMCGHYPSNLLIVCCGNESITLTRPSIIRTCGPAGRRPFPCRCPKSETRMLLEINVGLGSGKAEVNNAWWSAYFWQVSGMSLPCNECKNCSINKHHIIPHSPALLSNPNIVMVQNQEYNGQ